MTATTFTNCLPSPSNSIITSLDIVMTPLPKGPLTTDDRLRLQRELEQIKKTTNESQAAYKAAHASIPAFQQLVLTTHAQVAAAKQAVLQAKGITSSALSSNSSSNSSSCSTSPPSPSSPLENQSDSEGVQYLRKLEQEHVDLGIKLSQVLRDKAEAEETKKRLNDYIIRAKSRIKEIERKLLE